MTVASDAVVAEAGASALRTPALDGAPPLPLRTRIAFGVGALAENLALYSLTTFAMLYYNQVLGLPAYQAGLMISISLVVDAVADPMIGSWSDHHRGRLGRRHPFMFAAAIPLALSFFAVFCPPAGIGAGGLLAWFAGSVIVMRLALACYAVPHMALGAEMTPRYLERTSLMSYAAFFSWAGGSFAWWSAYALFFPTTPDYPTGLLNPAPWTTYAGVMAILIATTLLASAWFTRDRIPLLPEPDARTAGFSLRALGRDLAQTARNRNYVAIFVGWLLYYVMNGVRDGLWLYTANYYWRLSSEELSWWVVGSFAGYLFGFVAARAVHERIDKRRTLIWSMLLFTLGPPLGNLLAFAGVIGPETPHINAILIALALFEHGPQSFVLISVLSTLGDIADENELRFGGRQEGVLFATRILSSKVGLAIGSAVAGAAVSVVALPTGARPGQVAPSILTDLNLAYVLGSLPGFLAALAFTRYRITRQTFAATRAALDQRRRDGAPHVPS